MYLSNYQNISATFIFMVYFIQILANQAPALPGKNLMSLRHPCGHFTLHKVFSPVTPLGFRVWGTPGSRGWVGGVMLVLRIFTELVWRSVQNLVEIGLVARAWKGDIGTNSTSHINRLAEVPGAAQVNLQPAEHFFLCKQFSKMCPSAFSILCPQA